MKPKDHSTLATELVEQVERYHKLENPSASEAAPLQAIRTVLEKRRLIFPTGEESTCSRYVVRDKVTRLPLLLSQAKEEIVICTQAFAHECFTACAEKHPRVELLLKIR